MAKQHTYPLLEQADTPDKLRVLPESLLAPLAQEIRDFLIDSVGKTGGHLAAGLGVVELTIALHYVFNTPDDRLIWDVGHQTYPHKILTGRRERMGSLRKKGGIAGFPKRSESSYDSFGVGHSSTSVSAALGMAIAAQNQGHSRKVIAVIGDGAMTAGMAFEAMNHAGDLDADLLVILNDNKMSISANVGGLSNYLARVMSGKLYSTVRAGSKKVLQVMPTVKELARRAEEHMKGMVIPGTLFEELGFNYIGPIDGHDLPTLIATLKNLRSLSGPQFLHVITQKGKGYAFAEDDPSAYHGVSALDPQTGRRVDTKSGPPSYSEVFGDWLCDMATADERLIGITPAMCEGSGMVEFARRFPDRYFDVGIAEQHSVTLAAGLSAEGLKPVVAIYSTFLQRAYDQLIHDVALQNLPVVFAVDRAGLVGADGPTHAGSFDLSFLRCIPGMVVMAPADENECRRMLCTAFQLDGPSAVRYPRGTGLGIPVDKALNPLPLGLAEVKRRGSKVAILAFGSRVAPALEVAEAIDATLVNMRFVKPLDGQTLLQAAREHEIVVTVEENTVLGGAGSAINEWLATHGCTVPILNLGLPDRFVAQGSHAQLLSDCGLDTQGIRRAIEAFLDNSLAKNLQVD